MRYGRTCEKGFLPVYSVDTEEEARILLMLTCSTVKEGPQAGEFVARELAHEQTLDKLFAFGERLAEAHRTRMPKYSGVLHKQRTLGAFYESVAEALGPQG